MKRDDYWRLEINDKQTGQMKQYLNGTGPVELMQAAGQAAGVKWGKQIKVGEIYGSTTPSGDLSTIRWKKADGNIDLERDPGWWSLRPVIPAEPEPAPCPNCQGATSKYYVSAHVKDLRGPAFCDVCRRPESEWTYAQDPQDDPERWIGGVL